MTTESLWSNYVDPDPEPPLPPRTFELRLVEDRDLMFPRNGADHLLRIITPTGPRSTEAQALRFTPPELAALYDALGIYLDSLA